VLTHNWAEPTARQHHSLSLPLPELKQLHILPAQSKASLFKTKVRRKFPAAMNPQQFSQELQTHTAMGGTAAVVPQRSTPLVQRPLLAELGFGNSPKCIFIRVLHRAIH